MHCPFCNEIETRVIDSRWVPENNQVRRRRECAGCGERFTTYECAELSLPRIVKNSELRVAFDEDKLRAGIMRALEKRPVKTEQIDSAIQKIKTQLRATGEREVSSRQVGEWVMNALRELDEVAYVRFASVYRQFQDVKAFQEEITRLLERNDKPKAESVS